MVLLSVTKNNVAKKVIIIYIIIFGTNIINDTIELTPFVAILVTFESKSNPKLYTASDISTDVLFRKSETTVYTALYSTFIFSNILFNLNNTKIISRLLDGKFVNYASLLPSEYKLLVNEKSLPLLKLAEPLFDVQLNNIFLPLDSI